jgi:uncharacterized protein (TIGR03435 family)
MLVSKVFCGVFLSFMVLTSCAHAQSAAAPVAVASYDAVSIKLNKSGSGSVHVSSDAAYYNATNVSVKMLLQSVYDIRETLISGIPAPIESQRFDVAAKIVEPDMESLKQLTQKERREMLLPALVERFHLQAHTEIKILPVFELVVVANGPKFQQTVDAAGKNSGTSVNNHGHGAELTMHGVSMKSFEETLSYQVHRTVIDKTGLAEKYDLALKWTPEDSPDTSADALPGIFTALQEQLGLKLVPAKGPVETLVVDHVEIPTEN